MIPHSPLIEISCKAESGAFYLDALIIIKADTEFVYEVSDRYVALTSDSPENEMFTAVTAVYTPAVDD